MSRQTYSGEDVRKVLINNGPFRLDRINGDHYILKWDPPPDHDSELRTVVVPDHDEIRTGTLKSIGTQAGMKDFNEFLDWLSRNV